MQKPKKSITISQLPGEVVDDLKVAAISLDCKIHELAEVIFRKALKDVTGLYPEVYELRKQNRQMREKLRKVTSEAEQIGELLNEPTT